jgi:hypothetical protein
MDEASWIETLLRAYPLLAETKSGVTDRRRASEGGKGTVSGGRDGWLYWIYDHFLRLLVVDMNYDYEENPVPSSFN